MSLQASLLLLLLLLLLFFFSPQSCIANLHKNQWAPNNNTQTPQQNNTTNTQTPQQNNTTNTQTQQQTNTQTPQQRYLYVVVDLYHCRNISTHYKACQTLGQYMTQTDKYFTDNTTLVFEAGTHLTSNTHVEINSVHNFEMLGIGNFTKKEYRKNRTDFVFWESTSVIKCQGDRAGINFTQITNFVIRRITFTVCSGPGDAYNHRYKGALIIDTAYNVLLHSVTVRDNKGFGLHAYGLYGNATIFNCTFANNTNTQPKYSGNAHIIYQDCETHHPKHTNLTIRQSNFLLGNSNIGYYYYPYASGVSILVKCRWVYITIQDVLLRSNSAMNGGNMAVTVYSGLEGSIAIRDSQIENGNAERGGGLKVILHRTENGLYEDSLSFSSPSAFHHSSSSSSSSFSSSSSSSSPYFSSIIPSSSSSRFSSSSSYPSSSSSSSSSSPFSFSPHTLPNILLKNITFRNNTATKGGGALYITTYKVQRAQNSYIYIDNCTFVGNSVHSDGSGSVAEIFKHSLPKYEHYTSLQFIMAFKNCVFDNNYPSSEDDDEEYDEEDDTDDAEDDDEDDAKSDEEKKVQAVTLGFYSVEMIHFENCNFTNNKATALSLVDSNACFGANIRFVRNRGVNGGAVKFCQASAIYISNHTSVIFDSNHASVAGGALFSEAKCSPSASPCFFQPQKLQNQTQLFMSNFMDNLVFINNTADYAGDAIYGGSISGCFTYSLICYLTPYRYQECSSYFSKGFYKRSFNLIQQKGISVVSSNPVDVCLCTDNKANCSVRNYYLPYPVFPGQDFTISAVVVGQLDGQRPGSISCSIESEHTTNIIRGPFSPHTSKECQELTLAVGTNQTQNTEVIISFKHVPIDPTTQAFFYSKSPPTVTLRLLPCPWGFQLRNNSCICDSALPEVDGRRRCSIKEQTITRVRPYWIGSYSRNKHTHNCSSNDSTCIGVVVTNHCPFDYCTDNTVHMNYKTLQMQCANNREGILCGRCREGYSLTIGKSNCRKCSETYLLILLMYAILGVLLVAVLIIFKLTVSMGTLHGLIFYVNFVQFNQSIYFPSNSDHRLHKMTYSFVSWFSLNTGSEICLTRSMDAYTKTWINYSFPVYIWLLAVIIIALSRRSTRVTRLVGRNAVQILATLVFISYAELLRIIIETLQFIKIVYANTSVYVWLRDANIQYWELKRIPVIIISALFGLACLLYALILTFIPCLYRVSHRSAFFWVQKWKPFFDAYTGPYKTKYAFWPGLMFLVRLFFFTAFALNVLGSPSLNMFLTVLLCLLIITAAWVLGGVYRNPRIDILEAFFVVNLGALSLVTLLFNLNTDYDDDDNQTQNKGLLISQQQVVTVSTLASIIVFIGILIYHCYQRLLTTQWIQRLGEWLRQRQQEQEESEDGERDGLLVNDARVASTNELILNSSCEVACSQELVSTQDLYTEPAHSYGYHT